MKKIMTLLCLSLLTLSIAGCANTFNGAGQDMEHMGKSMQDTF